MQKTLSFSKLVLATWAGMVLTGLVIVVGWVGTIRDVQSWRIPPVWFVAGGSVLLVVLVLVATAQMIHSLASKITKDETEELIDQAVIRLEHEMPPRLAKEQALLELARRMFQLSIDATARSVMDDEHFEAKREQWLLDFKGRFTELQNELILHEIDYRDIVPAFWPGNVVTPSEIHSQCGKVGAFARALMQKP